MSRAEKRPAHRGPAHPRSPGGVGRPPPPRGVGTNHEAVRRHNLSALLGHLHRDGSLSRATLTKRMRLGRSTIGALVAELESLGLVAQLQPEGGRNGVGRPSMHVQTSSDRVLVLAAQVGENVLRGAAFALGGKVAVRQTAPTPSSRAPSAVVGALGRLLRKIAALLPEDTVLVGVGVGVPGLVGPEGMVRSASNLGWTNVPLAALLERELPCTVPVHVAHDVNLGALAEVTRGAAKGQLDVIYLGCDVGLGAGIRVNGRPLTGVGGFAGELGHLILDPHGRLCRCGRRGCWETEVNAVAVAAALGHPTDRLADLGKALAAMQAPPPALQAIGRQLGRGLGNVVNAFNPAMIILGGILRDLYPAVREEADRAFSEVALEGPREQVRITLPALGSDSVLYGAAELALDELLANPVGAVARARRWTVHSMNARGA